MEKHNYSSKWANGLGKKSTLETQRTGDHPWPQPPRENYCKDPQVWGGGRRLEINHTAMRQQHDSACVREALDSTSNAIKRKQRKEEKGEPNKNQSILWRTDCGSWARLPAYPAQMNWTCATAHHHHLGKGLQSCC